MAGNEIDAPYYDTLSWEGAREVGKAVLITKKHTSCKRCTQTQLELYRLVDSGQPRPFRMCLSHEVLGQVPLLPATCLKESVRIQGRQTLCSSSRTPDIKVPWCCSMVVVVVEFCGMSVTGGRCN